MITIGDTTFDVPQPGAMASFALQQRILPIAGRLVACFFRVLGIAPDAEASQLAGMDVAKVLPQALPYVGEVLAAMPPGELEAITRALLGKATFSKGGSKQLALFGGASGDVFDAVMRGKTIETWHLLWHALEVWYPDFFGRARALFAGALVEASRSQASSTSAPVGLAGAS